MRILFGRRRLREILFWPSPISDVYHSFFRKEEGVGRSRKGCESAKKTLAPPDCPHCCPAPSATAVAPPLFGSSNAMRGDTPRDAAHLLCLQLARRCMPLLMCRNGFRLLVGTVQLLLVIRAVLVPVFMLKLVVRMLLLVMLLEWWLLHAIMRELQVFWRLVVVVVVVVVLLLLLLLLMSVVLVFVLFVGVLMMALLLMVIVVVVVVDVRLAALLATCVTVAGTVWLQGDGIGSALRSARRLDTTGMAHRRMHLMFARRPLRWLRVRLHLRG